MPRACVDHTLSRVLFILFLLLVSLAILVLKREVSMRQRPDASNYRVLVRQMVEEFEQESGKNKGTIMSKYVVRQGCGVALGNRSMLRSHTIAKRRAVRPVDEDEMQLS